MLEDARARVTHQRKRFPQRGQSEAAYGSPGPTNFNV